MSIESAGDLKALKRVGHVVALTLDALQAAARVGISTSELDTVAASMFTRFGARSAPQLVYGFPGTVLLSVNDEIVHGVPGDRRLQSGDVVKLDVTAELHGYVADAARTIMVGDASPIATRLQRSAKSALSAALRVARSGERVSVIGKAVESQARADGFAVVRELTGHGVGRTIHEDPQVPNYEDRFSPDMLTDGLVIAIEPMLSVSRTRTVVDDDGWTIRTANGCLAVHEEHTVVIREGAPLVLTALQ